MRKRAILTVCMIILTGLTSFVQSRENERIEIGVFQYVLQKCDLDFESASNVLESAIQSSSFEFVNTIDETSPEDCGFRTRVFILYDPLYANTIVDINPQTGPFTIMDRINLFEDEGGLHVSIVNPANLTRTVLMEDEKYRDIAETHRKSLRSLILEDLTGSESEKQYGPFRKKGYIGRTMGIMAGGPFIDKVENVLVTTGQDLDDVVRILSDSLATESGKWGMTQSYSMTMPDKNIAVVGVSSSLIESRSFQIVKAGGDKSRKDFSCPGLAHAAAYPMEIVILQKENVYWIKLMDSMYRMKLYFEDAGKMAFAANMGMPGSIEKELKQRILSAFENK